MPGRYGFDARSGEYVDMIKAGIIDPATLQGAASIAGMMITTEAMVAQEAETGGQGMQGDGMDGAAF